MRLFTFAFLLCLVFSCSKDEAVPNDAITQENIALTKALIVKIEFPSSDVCGEDNGLNGIDIIVKNAIEDDSGQQVAALQTNWYGRVDFLDLPAGDYRIVAESQHGSTEIDITYDGDRQVFILSF